MPLIRKRRAEQQPESADEDDVSTPINSRHPRRRTSTSESDDGDASDEARAPSSLDVMVKKLVRLALARELSRQPVRRTDISNKVLGEQGSRQFKLVFEMAQKSLRETFGMQLSELPGKEKVTIQQRRAAQRTDRPSASNRSWILTTTLPPAYRTPEILPPTKAPLEGTLTGLYSFIIAVITLNGGSLPEQKLERYLKRTNADTFTPIDRTDRFLQRLCKEGYLLRTREMDGGEEVVEYLVGPRGKIEVGVQGVAGLVREVYGRQGVVEGDDTTPAEGQQMSEFEARLARSLGIKKLGRTAEDEDVDGDRYEEDGEGSRRRRRRGGDSDDEADSD
ncbi:MAGE domain-containing protein [Aspergillus clavatus NRRL 1]|uniref:MAGE domain-containing protein n=1 Tax=Aspergillus clavatus (strain ATCC 1007 / CBS 513.65 / DSM 816 / NCTC 3887 / NRRL 1 / QM 1276 / 107) TaxID=344612 RepID=A1CR46_ASPCL|nr:uncharacterized protein ACLA_028420 [Aspergillus clavatus NRRL 1]EAW08117.1 conserved hypothetical protein [Aspergillus clavatus NRRL 1]